MANPDNNTTRKGWNQDPLRHFPKMLARWAGGRACLFELTVGMAALTILIRRENHPGNLQLSGWPKRIHAPYTWENCRIEVAHHPQGHVLRDTRADVEIIFEGLGIYENAKIREFN